MNNKVLVEVIVPIIEEKYDIYIPINKRIGKVIEQLNKTIHEMNEDRYQITNEICLYNRDTNQKYDVNTLVYDSDIRNGTALILL